MPSSHSSNDAAIVLACTLGYAALGWMLNGLGSVLPPLRDEVGDVAGVYPLIPGIAALVTAVITALRQRRAAPAGGMATVGWSMGALAVAMLATGLTQWPAISVAATVAMTFAGARLGRALPGVLASLPGRDTNHLLMRVNGYSSLAGVLAPLSVGATLAIGLGWLSGYAGPIAVAAIVVAVLVRGVGSNAHAANADADADVDADADDGADGSVPVATLRPTRASGSWRWTMLVMTLAIVVEFCFSYFAATYLREELGLSKAAAAAGAAAWGVGMTAGRLASRGGRSRSILPSLGVIGLGFVAMWLAPNAAVAIAGFVVAGIGAAPLYPNLMTTLLERFPGHPNQAATYGLMSSGLALVGAPGAMVALRAISDVRTAYLVVPVLLVLLAVLTTADRATAR